MLVCIARTPGARLRDVAECVGITERAAQRIVGELCEAGYLSRQRLGRRSFYEVHPDAPMRRPLEGDRRIGDVLSVLLEERPQRERAA